MSGLPKLHAVTDLASLEKAVLATPAAFEGDVPWWRGHSEASWNSRRPLFARGQMMSTR
jgi:hypothetical protein